MINFLLGIALAVISLEFVPSSVEDTTDSTNLCKSTRIGELATHSLRKDGKYECAIMYKGGLVNRYVLD